MGVLTSHLAPIDEAFFLFYKSSVLMPHLSPGLGECINLSDLQTCVIFIKIMRISSMFSFTIKSGHDRTSRL